MPRPKLTPEILTKDHALGATIEAFLGSRMANSGGEVVRRQEALRCLVTPEAWTVFLGIEEAMQDHATEAQDELVRWSFREGMRAGRCVRGKERR